MSPTPAELVKLAADDCMRLLQSLEDALKDLNMYPCNEESLDKVVRDSRLSVDLASRLLGVKVSDNSWRHLMAQSQMPTWLASQFLTGRPQYSSKLEALLFMALKSQQAKLLQQKNTGSHQLESAQSGHDEPKLNVTSSPSLDKTLPSFLSEKQREALLLCYRHLKRDYECRRQAMHKRLAILEASFGSDPPSGDQETEPARSENLSPSTVTSLLEHFSQTHSVRAPAPTVTTQIVSTVVATGPASDRGGRLDDISRIELPKWTEERKPTLPSQGQSGRLKGKSSSPRKHENNRKRGNSDATKKTSPRKKS